MRTGEHSRDMKHLELDRSMERWPGDDGKTRVLLAAINVPGYYSLPVRVLALVAHDCEELRETFETRYVEWDERESLEAWLETISAWKPDILALSVNIWNRDQCFRFSEMIKRRLPETVVLTGGQEMTNSAIDYLRQVPEIDYIIDGEGELSFHKFLGAWDPTIRGPKDPETILGLRYRDGEQTKYSGVAEAVSSLDEVPSVILAGLVPVHGKRKLGVMLEGARGCPFRCGFCFEGAKKNKVRTASLERICEEARYMASRGSTYFHIMDPILCNSDLERLRGIKELFTDLAAIDKRISVSVEGYGEHITEEVAECLGAFSIVDIGLQTTNPPTAKAIRRRFSPDKFREGLLRLENSRCTTNIYLIHGLPHETPLTFLRGVRFSLDQNPTRIFLNELRLLNGTELRRNADELGYVFEPAPPYRVQETSWIPRHDLEIVQALSRDVERRHNMSQRALFPMVPWMPKHRGCPDGTVGANLNGGCSRGCPGCAAADSSPKFQDGDELARLTDQAANADVEIITGDAAERGDLVREIGQFLLAGAARIRIIAPPSLFGDAELLEHLVQRGAWHYKTFIPCSAVGDGVPNHTDVPNLTSLDTGLRTLGRSFSRQGRGEIRPYAEVAIMATDCPADRVRKIIRRTAECGASAVAVSDGFCQLDDALIAEMKAAVLEAARAGYWLKLPRSIARHVFSDWEDVDETMDLMASLSLLSEESEHPPCFHEAASA